VNSDVAARPDIRPQSRLRRVAGRWTLTVWAGLGIAYLFAPIVFIVAFSFNNPRGRFNFEWDRFSFDAWLHPFAERELTDALWVSLRVALIAMVAATILGALIAMALARYRFKGGTLVDLLLILPLTTPEVVFGFSLFALFFDRGIDRGFWTIVIAHVSFCVSFVALTVKARIRGFDWTLEHAAMDLGATPWRTFRTVTLPLITPGILAAGLLSFALSIDDFIITLFNAGTTVTFPLQIFGAQQRSVPPQINVLATMILLVSIGIVVLGTLVRLRRDKV
jgi:spermidine/putrescine transport system permease protein